MVIGYLRVSTEKQQLNNQRCEIIKFAKSANFTIDEWKEEIVSGTKGEENRVLGEILNKIHEGDILIISEISRLSRRFMEIISIFNRCIKKKVIIFSVKEKFELSDNMNSKILSFAFSLTAEVERDLISMRTKEALARKKAEGVILGRPKGNAPKVNALNKHAGEIIRKVESKISRSLIAKEYSVSRTTLYYFLKDAGSKIKT